MKTNQKIEEIASILLLKSIKGFGPVKFKKVYRRFGSFTTFVDYLEQISKKPSYQFTFSKFNYLIIDVLNARLAHRISRLFEKGINKEKYKIIAQELLSQAKKVNGHVITYFDEYYPRNLYNTNQSVPILYAIGNISLLNKQKYCAVVGTRNPSNWTITYTKKLVRKLVKENYIIVSGLALGIDSIAHKETLENNGKTIAVVGCGPDIYYPPQNKTLYEWIKKQGLIISEYPFGTQVRSLYLKKRNKIIVGLSNVVYITETSIRGGTMNSYRAAVEQKKLVKLFLPRSNVGGDFSGNLRIYLDSRIKVDRIPTDTEPNMERLPHMKAIIFDLDGTIWDPTDAICSAILSLSKNKGTKISSREMKNKVIKSLCDLHYFLEEYEIDLPSYWKVYRKNYEKIKLFSPLTKEILKKLVRSGKKIGIVTSLKKQIASELLDRFGIKDIFSVMISPSESRARKPSPKPILKALALLNVPKNKAIYIGDCDTDIKAAKAAGCFSGLAAWNKYISITQMPDYIFLSFDDLLLLLGGS